MGRLQVPPGMSDATSGETPGQEAGVHSGAGEAGLISQGPPSV